MFQYWHIACIFLIFWLKPPEAQGQYLIPSYSGIISQTGFLTTSAASIGCYKDQSFSDLPYLVVTRSPNINLPFYTACTTVCAMQGMSNVALQDDTTCLCGPSYGKFGTAQASKCRQCSAAALSTLRCGGVNFNSVYSLTFFQMFVACPLVVKPAGIIVCNGQLNYRLETSKLPPNPFVITILPRHPNTTQAFNITLNPPQTSANSDTLTDKSSLSFRFNLSYAAEGAYKISIRSAAFPSLTTAQSVFVNSTSMVSDVTYLGCYTSLVSSVQVAISESTLEMCAYTCSTLGLSFSACRTGCATCFCATGVTTSSMSNISCQYPTTAQNQLGGGQTTGFTVYQIKYVQATTGTGTTVTTTSSTVTTTTTTSTTTTTLIPNGWTSLGINIDTFRKPGVIAQSSQLLGLSVMGCFHDIAYSDVPYQVFVNNPAGISTSTCTYACTMLGLPIMAFQNSKSCLCGNSYGRYGTAPSSSCVDCSGYNCGGSSTSGIHYLQFFELTLICPLVVAGGQSFTCWISVSYNLASSLENPLTITVYPFYTSYLREFDLQVPLPTSDSTDSFNFNNTVTFSFNFTYSAASPSRTIYVFAPSYPTAYAHQTIYVNSSSPVDYVDYVGCYTQMVSPVQMPSSSNLEGCLLSCSNRNFLYAGCLKQCTVCMCSNGLVNSSVNPYLCNYPCSNLIQMCGGFTTGYTVYQIVYKAQTTTSAALNTITTTTPSTTTSWYSSANEPASLPGINSQTSQIISVTELGCYKDVNLTDVPYNVMTVNRLTASNIQFCTYACTSQGFAYMAIQNRQTCACGSTYGRYGLALASLCSNCQNYNCGGLRQNGIHYVNFFQLNLICPLVVKPGVTFTCVVEMSFNLPSGVSIVDPFELAVYPYDPSGREFFTFEALLPLGTSSSLSLDKSLLRTTFDFTYDNSSSSNSLYIYPTAYSTSYTYQTIYVDAKSTVTGTIHRGCFIELGSPSTQVTIASAKVENCAWTCSQQYFRYSACKTGCAECWCTNTVNNNSYNKYLCNYPAYGTIQYGGGYLQGYTVYEIFYVESETSTSQLIETSSIQPTNEVTSENAKETSIETSQPHKSTESFVNLTTETSIAEETTQQLVIEETSINVQVKQSTEQLSTTELLVELSSYQANENSTDHVSVTHNASYESSTTQSPVEESTVKLIEELSTQMPLIETSTTSTTLSEPFTETSTQESTTSTSSGPVIESSAHQTVENSTELVSTTVPVTSNVTNSTEQLSTHLPHVETSSTSTTLSEPFTETSTQESTTSTSSGPVIESSAHQTVENSTELVSTVSPVTQNASIDPSTIEQSIINSTEEPMTRLPPTETSTTSTTLSEPFTETSTQESSSTSTSTPSELLVESSPYQTIGATTELVLTEAQITQNASIEASIGQLSTDELSTDSNKLPIDESTSTSSTSTDQTSTQTQTESTTVKIETEASSLNPTEPSTVQSSSLDLTSTLGSSTSTTPYELLTETSTQESSSTSTSTPSELLVESSSNQAYENSTELVPTETPISQNASTEVSTSSEPFVESSTTSTTLNELFTEASTQESTTSTSSERLVESSAHQSTENSTELVPTETLISQNASVHPSTSQNPTEQSVINSTVEHSTQLLLVETSTTLNELFTETSTQESTTSTPSEPLVESSVDQSIETTTEHIFTSVSVTYNASIELSTAQNPVEQPVINTTEELSTQLPLTETSTTLNEPLTETSSQESTTSTPSEPVIESSAPQTVENSTELVSTGSPVTQNASIDSSTIEQSIINSTEELTTRLPLTETSTTLSEPLTETSTQESSSTSTSTPSESLVQSSVHQPIENSTELVPAEASIEPSTAQNPIQQSSVDSIEPLSSQIPLVETSTTHFELLSSQESSSSTSTSSTSTSVIEQTSHQLSTDQTKTSSMKSTASLATEQYYSNDSTISSSTLTTTLAPKGWDGMKTTYDLLHKPGIISTSSQVISAGVLGCYNDVDYSDLPYQVYLNYDRNISISRCYYACTMLGFPLMGLQNSSSCLCGNSYGRYGPADNTSSCATCTGGYVCGGPNLMGVHLLRFFEITMICPLIVAPNQVFTCWLSVSYYLSQVPDNPLIITVYPKYSSASGAFNLSIPLPSNQKNSFDSLISFNFNYSYSASTTNRTMLAFSPAYSSAYAYQTIIVNSSSPIDYVQYVGCYTQMVSPVQVSTGATLENCILACSNLNFLYAGCLKGCSTCMCSNGLVNSSMNPYLCNYPCNSRIQMGGGYSSGYSVYQIVYDPVITSTTTTTITSTTRTTTMTSSTSTTTEPIMIESTSIDPSTNHSSTSSDSTHQPTTEVFEIESASVGDATTVDEELSTAGYTVSLEKSTQQDVIEPSTQYNTHSSSLESTFAFEPLSTDFVQKSSGDTLLEASTLQSSLPLVETSTTTITPTEILTEPSTQESTTSMSSEPLVESSSYQAIENSTELVPTETLISQNASVHPSTSQNHTEQSVINSTVEHSTQLSLVETSTTSTTLSEPFTETSTQESSSTSTSTPSELLVESSSYQTIGATTELVLTEAQITQNASIEATIGQSSTDELSTDSNKLPIDELTSTSSTSTNQTSTQTESTTVKIETEASSLNPTEPSTVQSSSSDQTIALGSSTVISSTQEFNELTENVSTEVPFTQNSSLNLTSELQGEQLSSTQAFIELSTAQNPVEQHAINSTEELSTQLPLVETTSMSTTPYELLTETSTHESSSTSTSTPLVESLVESSSNQAYENSTELVPTETIITQNASTEVSTSSEPFVESSTTSTTLNELFTEASTQESTTSTSSEPLVESSAHQSTENSTELLSTTVPVTSNVTNSTEQLSTHLPHVETSSTSTTLSEPLTEPSTQKSSSTTTNTFSEPLVQSTSTTTLNELLTDPSTQESITSTPSESLVQSSGYQTIETMTELVPTETPITQNASVELSTAQNPVEQPVINTTEELSTRQPVVDTSTTSLSLAELLSTQESSSTTSTLISTTLVTNLLSSESRFDSSLHQYTDASTSLPFFESSTHQTADYAYETTTAALIESSTQSSLLDSSPDVFSTHLSFNSIQPDKPSSSTHFDPSLVETSTNKIVSEFSTINQDVKTTSTSPETSSMLVELTTEPPSTTQALSSNSETTVNSTTTLIQASESITSIKHSTEETTITETITRIYLSSSTTINSIQSTERDVATTTSKTSLATSTNVSNPIQTTTSSLGSQSNNSLQFNSTQNNSTSHSCHSDSFYLFVSMDIFILALYVICITILIQLIKSRIIAKFKVPDLPTPPQNPLPKNPVRKNPLTKKTVAAQQPFTIKYFKPTRR